MWSRAGLSGAAPLVVFANALLGRQLLAPGDGERQYLPLHMVAARAWRAGGLPVWNPYSFSGYPLLATSQAGVFYPPNLVFLWLSPGLANNVVVVANFVVAAVGAFLLARHLCGDDGGAFVAALSFGLCGFLFAHIGHQSMIASVSWLPWALLAYERLRGRVTAGRLLLGGGSLAMAAIAGHGQMFFLIVLVVALYATGLALFGGPRPAVRPLAVAALLVAVGTGLGALQLLPTWAVLGASDRATLDYQSATSYSLPKSHLPLLAFPYLFGNQVPQGPFSAPYRGAWNLTELGGYPGAAALVLAAAGLGWARRDRRVVVLVGVAGVALVMAMGSSTPFGRVVHALPVYGQFRSWGRYLVVVDLVVAMLAGYGVASLRAGGAARATALRWAATAAGVLVTAAVGLRWVPSVRDLMVTGWPGRLAFLLPAVAAVACAVIAVLLTRRPRLAMPALALVVAADAVGSFGWHYEWRGENRTRDELQRDFSPAHRPRHRALPDAPGGIERYIYVSADLGAIERRQYVNVTDAQGLRSANGFDPLAPRDYLEAMGDMVYFGVVRRPERLWRPESHILDLLRVSLVLQNPPSTRSPIPADSLVGAGAPVPGTHLVRHPYVPRLPDAFVVGEVRQHTRERVLEHLDGSRPLVVGSTALVERPCRQCRSMRSPGRAGVVRSAHWDMAKARFDVDSSRPGMLVVSQAWFPGWEATVAGRRAPVLRVDGLVQGVPVPAGRHNVALRYRAPGLRAGAAISVLTLVLLMGWLVMPLLARPRRPPPAELATRGR